MKRVVNYARNVRTREYVFLRDGEEPGPEHLGSEWIWHEPPTGYACKIGLTAAQNYARSERYTRERKSNGDMQ